MLINEKQQTTTSAEQDTPTKDLLANASVNRIVAIACLSVFPLIYFLGRAITEWGH